MNNQRKSFIFGLLLWQVLILLFFYLGLQYLPLQQNSLGGSSNFQRASLMWAHANYDGEHYLTIAQFGYSPLHYFFFPLYPIMIRFLAQYLHYFQFPLPIAGILISLTAFFIGFVTLYKLLRLDYSNKVTQFTLLLILLCPTSFYFTGVYTESLFFCLCVSCFYFARKQNFIAAGIFGFFASATRIVGLVLFISIFLEWWQLYKKKETGLMNLIPTFVIPFGLVSYMWYLNYTTGDFLAFFHNLNNFGGQRSDHFVLLPQVFYRYIFKILPNLPQYLPVVLTTILEFFTGSLFLIISILSFFKLRKSYAVFVSLGYLIPTLTGSFSSLPRYVLVLFPAFLLIALYFEKWKRKYQYFVLGLSTILLAVFTMMFVVGYWVS